MVVQKYTGTTTTKPKLEEANSNGNQQPTSQQSQRKLDEEFTKLDNSSSRLMKICSQVIDALRK